MKLGKNQHKIDCTDWEHCNNHISYIQNEIEVAIKAESFDRAARLAKQLSRILGMRIVRFRKGNPNLL